MKLLYEERENERKREYKNIKKENISFVYFIKWNQIDNAYIFCII